MNGWILRVSITTFFLMVSLAQGYTDDMGTSLPLDNMLDNMILKYKEESFRWVEPVRNAALSLFHYLLLIEFVWTAILMVLGSAEIEQFIAEFIKRVLFAGFFLSLLHYGHVWSDAIISSFVDIGERASGSTYVSASDVFEMGLVIVKDIMKNIRWFSFAEPVIISLISLIIMALFSLTSAIMVLTYIESYVVSSAAIILLGFGASRWTRDYAKAFLIYAVSVGLKLFSLILIVNTGFKVIIEWQSLSDGNFIEQDFMLLGVSLIFFTLVLAIPNIIASLVRSTNLSTSNELMKVASLTSSIAKAGSLASMAVYKTGRGGMGMGSALRAGAGATMAKGTKGFRGIAGGTMSEIYHGIKEGTADNLSKKTSGGKLAERINKARKDYDKKQPKKYY